MHTDTVSDQPANQGGMPPRPAGVDYAFGRFSLHPGRKLLACDGAPVTLGGRAFDLLVALVARAGDVVSHQELVAAVWPHAVVEENGLRVHMSALRKALAETPADQYIMTVLGRGYRFVKPVCAAPAAGHSQPGWSPLPPMPAVFDRRAGLGRLLGRATVATELDALLAGAALVTLTGPGGIGKTAVALDYAATHGARHADGCHLVDFAALDDPALVPAAIGSALGISLQQVDPLSGICNALAALHTLLVFDNCEHVLGAAAEFAGQIVATAPRVRVLATSRAALGVAGEAVYRLPPLALPAPDAAPDCAAASMSPAVALFVERAQANSSDFVLDPGNLPTVLRLCQQLDGLPLAIELAAARVEALGVEGLAARLDDMLGLLTRSRRLASPRHAALETMLDCSHRLLGDVERTVFRRLSVFHAAFSLESAALVCAFDTLAPAQVLDAVLALADKSLLTVDADHRLARYRFLNTTRRYAAARLAASGEGHASRRRHATHLCTLFGQARAEIDERSLPRWYRRYGGLSADLLAALDWAFGSGGEPMLGLALCVAVPLPMIELGMVDQFRRRLDMALQALGALVAAEAVTDGVELEARLLAAWTLATTHVAMPPEQRIRMYARLVDAAPRVRAPEARALVASALCVGAFIAGDYARIGAVAAQARLDSTGMAVLDPAARVARLLATRWGALGLHFQGRHRAAREQALHTLDTDMPGGHSNVLGPIPQRIVMGVVMARSEWITGEADVALVRARQIVTLAENEHPFALSLALGLALAPVALWRGDDALALETLERLESHARRHALSFWSEWAVHLRLSMGDAAPAGEHQLAAVRELVAAQPMMLELLATTRPGFLPPAALATAARGQETWCEPELLRIQAESAHANGAPRASVEAALAHAMVTAQAQGALAWELRAATSLARIWAAAGRQRRAGELLDGVLGRFHQGFDTADLRAARDLRERFVQDPDIPAVPLSPV